jgi:hypothetical protein
MAYIKEQKTLEYGTRDIYSISHFPILKLHVNSSSGFVLFLHNQCAMRQFELIVSTIEVLMDLFLQVITEKYGTRR